MTNHILIFILALIMLVKGATLSSTYAARVADRFRLSKYTVGFFIVAIISILPETLISVSAAMNGVPEFGLGVLFGSNIADLTLVFAVIVLLAGRGINVESKILKKQCAYPFLLLLPLLLGMDGRFTRPEGAALILFGVAFYFVALRNGTLAKRTLKNGNGSSKNVIMLLVGMALLLAGAHLTVTSASSLALAIGISPILIGMLVVGLGTTMPETIFAYKSVMKRNDSLAIGDILGTVLADATIVVGILALINPFFFPQRIIYVTGVFMVIAAFVLFHVMRTGKTLSRREALLLFAFWLAFVTVEFLANR